jgi:hypothetical protein
MTREEPTGQQTEGDKEMVQHLAVAYEVERTLSGEDEL